MRKLQSLLLALLLASVSALATLPCLATGTLAHEWQATPDDAKGALPNDNSPPTRLQPVNALPALTGDDIGMVRRVRLPAEKKVVALTFDLCELSTKTTGCDTAILGWLQQEGIAATLFMGGKWMRTHARRVRQLMLRPDLFEIGNHAWSHGNFALLSPAGMREQVLWTQAQYELVRESLGQSAAPAGANLPAVPRLFRLPYGRCTPEALRALADMGMKVIQWDLPAEAGDARQPEVARQVAANVVAQVRPGSILLFHANMVPKGTAGLLREVVAGLRSKGYSFAKVGDLLQMGPAETTLDGYFSTPGDNLELDGKFGIDGTGRRR